MNCKERQNKQIDVWLTEYRACYMNCNHWSSIIWTMGSIFVATSLTLFGVSFFENIHDNYSYVIALTFFSISMIIIWFLYVRHVQPWINFSIERMHEIEDELYDLGYDIYLHTSIREIDYIKNREGKGKWVMFFLIGLLIASWIARIMLLYPDP